MFEIFPKEFTVERSRWLRGEGSDASRLLRSEDHLMCCVGFFCKAMGFTDDELLEMSTLNALLTNHQQERNEEKIYLIDPFQGTAYMINDDLILHDGDREDSLTEEFKGLGIRVTFVD